MLGINQAGKREIQRLTESFGVPLGSVDDCQHLGAGRSELLVLVRQLAEVPAAERSKEAPKENKDDGSLPTIVAQGDLAPVQRRQAEARCECIHRHQRSRDWRIGSPIRT